MTAQLDWIIDGLRKRAKTRMGVAKAIGVSPSQVTRLLQGKRHLKAKEVSAIAAYLGTDVPAEFSESSSKQAYSHINAPAARKAALHVLSSRAFSDTEARAICRAILEAGA